MSQLQGNLDFGFFVDIFINPSNSIFFLIFGYPFLYECLVSKKMGQREIKKYECNLHLVAEKVEEKLIK